MRRPGGLLFYKGVFMDEVTFLDRKILLVDDDTAILKLLEVVLKKEKFVNIYRATTGKEAISMCRQYKPDMIILDIMLPDEDGFEVCKTIRTFSMAPILFLSAKTDEVDKIVSFAVGGDDYLTKPFSPREVVSHIKATLRRLDYYEKMKPEADCVNFGEYRLDLKKRELFKAGKRVDLTSKEYLLLEYLAKNQNITISKEQIIEHVWGNGYEGYDNTIMVHIRRIREKIEENPSMPKYLLTVKGRGYRFNVLEEMENE